MQTPLISRYVIENLRLSRTAHRACLVRKAGHGAIPGSRDNDLNYAEDVPKFLIQSRIRACPNSAQSARAA